MISCALKVKEPKLTYPEFKSNVLIWIFAYNVSSKEKFWRL